MNKNKAIAIPFTEDEERDLIERPIAEIYNLSDDNVSREQELKLYFWQYFPEEKNKTLTIVYAGGNDSWGDIEVMSNTSSLTFIYTL